MAKPKILKSEIASILPKHSTPALETAILEIQKEFGEGAIMRLGSNTCMHVDCLATDILGIDRALGGRGIPRGRIIEVFGPESAGKTTLCLEAIKAFQQNGEIAAFVDVEHAFDPKYAHDMGVNLDNLFISQPGSGEEALNIVHTLAKSGGVGLIVLDSVAALVTKGELTGEIGDAVVGAQARLMSAALRKLTPLLAKTNTTCIFTNQMREKIGIMFGCFSHQTPVKLEDGTSMNIGKIVNQKLKLNVKCHNTLTGELESKPITRWFKNGVDIDDFKMTDNEIGELKTPFRTLVVRYPDGSGHTKTSPTPNHLVETPSGYEHAEDIKIGDQVMCIYKRTVFSKDLEDLIIGSMFGDGSIKKSGKMTAYFREEHNIRQTGYLKWKHACFGALAGKYDEFPEHEEIARRTCRFETAHNTEFMRIKQSFYTGGRYKKLDPCLDLLTPFSLAIWYLDDGTKAAGRNRNEISMHKISDSAKERLALLFFERFGLSPHIRISNVTRITFDGDQSKRFEELIAPYVHPSMAYKLGVANMGSLLPNLDFGVTYKEEPIACEVFETRDLYKTGKEAVRYNLEVGDNHSYIAGDMMVHNSPETTPGGKALKFYSSIRIDIRKQTALKNADGSIYGNRTKVKIVKNKVAPPFKECEFEIHYGTGVCREASLIEEGVAQNIIEKRGTWLSFDGALFSQGQAAGIKELQNNKELFRKIYTAVAAKVMPKLDPEPTTTADAVASTSEPAQSNEVAS